MFTIDLRPQIIDDMCGSSSIKKYYKNAFKEKNNFTFPQVSMFLGNPGTGKTTSAKIIAKILNCHNPKKNKNGYYDPCNECPSCKDIINEKYNRDVWFYSGSTDRTEDILKIEEIINFPPSYDKNTVIILDEFQNIHPSGLSFFLNCTEAPKKNIYFIFCSMSFEKNTKEITALKSRSQKFIIDEPKTDEIIDYIIEVLEKQGKLDGLPEVFFLEGLPTIASYKQEGLRGILQNVERCLLSEIYDEKTITKELGIINENSVFLLMDRLINKDKSVIQDIINTDIQAFYNISKSLFLKAMIYKVYNPDNELTGWKKYSKNDNLETLIEHYLKMDELPYFQPNVFIYQLCKFLFNQKLQTLQRLNENNQNNTIENRPLQRRPINN